MQIINVSEIMDSANNQTHFACQKSIVWTENMSQLQSMNGSPDRNGVGKTCKNPPRRRNKRRQPAEIGPCPWQHCSAKPLHGVENVVVVS